MGSMWVGWSQIWKKIMKFNYERRPLLQGQRENRNYNTIRNTIHSWLYMIKRYWTWLIFATTTGFKPSFKVFPPNRNHSTRPHIPWPIQYRLYNRSNRVMFHSLIVNLSIQELEEGMRCPNYTVHHGVAFFSTFVTYAFFHAARKTLSNSKDSISLFWTENEFNQTNLPSP